MARRESNVSIPRSLKIFEADVSAEERQEKKQMAGTIIVNTVEQDLYRDLVKLKEHPEPPTAA